MKITLDQALQKGIEAHYDGKPQEAKHFYNFVLKTNPKHPDANHKMALLAVDTGNFHEAVPFFKKALKASPHLDEYWLNYINALIEFDRIDDAIAVLEQAKDVGATGDTFDQIEKRLSGVRNTVDFNTNSGELQEAPKRELQNLIYLHTQGQFEKALAQSSKLLIEFPNSINLYNIIGALNKGIGKLSEAVEAYKKALSLDPNFSEAYFNMGVTLQLQNKLEEAIEAYKQTLSIRPDYVDAYNNLGTALRDQEMPNEALETYYKALSFKPDYIEVYNNMGITLQEQGRLDEAIEAYKKALSIKPDYAEAYNNMGTAFRDQGEIEKAIEAFRKSQSIRPNYAGAFYNLGNILRDQGKLDEAIEAYNKALLIKPDYEEVYNNMGATLQEQGKLNEAINAYSKALSLKPNFAEALNNMGSTQIEQGKLEEAVEASNKALSLKPDFAEAYSNLGIALQKQGKLDEAIEAYNKALLINPDYIEVYSKLGVALQGTIFNQQNKDLQITIASMLSKKSYVRPRDIASASINLLQFEPSLQKYLKNFDYENIESPLNVVADLNELPLFLKLMSVCPLPDLKLEALLIKLRRIILSHVLNSKDTSPELFHFQSALALQCFTNEYVYNYTMQEEKELLTLEKIAERAFRTNSQPSPQVVLTLGSYRALNRYEWCASLIITEEIKEVFIRQIKEPAKEIKLKSSIPILEEITDKVSSKVRDQYEKSPYPRWVNLGLTSKPISVSKLVNGLNLKLYSSRITKIERPEILIAGCGTGQHSIETATRFKSSKVTAIDLSLSSLAYAKRKTEELEVKNIEYLQADILDLSQLNTQFTIIESTGVLHHMEDPFKGWKVLTTCLKPGGLMKIGLYSELARQHIKIIKKELNLRDFRATDKEISYFRDTIVRSDKDNQKLITKSSDFYSMSMLRDLLFHVQEHRFTIPLIKTYLDKLGLKFCGFESHDIVSHFKKTSTSKEDLYDLDKWQEYEEANPSAFAEMYQFWCQKVDGD